MNKKMSRRERDIKSKLMAAIAMLLVSSIMMVSTTYAWFTLSTAPEVTGISTSVGANGNLEMALMPTDGITKGAAADFGIKTEVGVDNVVAANTTWGNLVDLGTDPLAKTAYGLDKITLYPSKLNTTTNADGTTIAAAMLKTPAYGADGRVSNLLENTVTGTYDSGEDEFPVNSENGVRTVGTASGMTGRQLDYRNYRSSASTSMASAKTAASQSLNTNGNTLANIALKKATSENATYTEEEIAPLLIIVEDLLGTAANTTGVLEHIENAYRSYIIAYGASKDMETQMDDTAFSAFKGTINAQATLADVVTKMGEAGITLPANINAAITALQSTIATVKQAESELTALTGDAITWAQLSVPLTKLANVEAMKINGIAASEVKTGNNMSTIVNGAMKNGLTVSMASGGGVYADVADHCGDYNAQVEIDEVSYGGVTLEDMPARMETESTVSTAYLAALSSTVQSADAPTGTGTVMPISDHYGYVIDLAFRTNAATSNLLLQTAPVDRIYTENAADAETMGHGSTMTFKSTTTDFTLDQLKNLMSAIRVVFFDPTNNKVYANAMLDLGDDQYTSVGGNTITANLYLYENTTYTAYRVAGDSETPEYVEVPVYTAATATNPGIYYKDGDEYKLADENTPADETRYYISNYEYRAPVEGETATHVDYEATGARLLKTQNDAIITAMGQNTAKAVSALIYLDGENVGNDDVSATAGTSMTGSLNLQFSSSATLEPMNYTPLMVQDATTPTT